MQEYVANLKARKSHDPLNLKFQKPNQSTIALENESKAETKSKTKTSKKKGISVASPVGTYERQSQWDGATLQIIKLKGNKIKFGLTASHGANTGGASGVVDLIDNKAAYKGSGFKLGFDYRGKSVIVTESGDGFGGMNVHADGVYKKTDDRIPTIEDLY